jgi:transposase
LSTYLEEKTGIKLSSGQIRNILKKNNYSYIWAKYSLETKKDIEKREAFKEKLEGYMKIAKENPKLIQIWFLDESGFSLRVIRRKCWGQKGKRKKLAGERKRGRVNVMGFLRYSDKKRFVEFVKKGNSETFYEVMKVFYAEAMREWVEDGNLAEEFEAKGPKIVIILDNASFHKKAEIIKQIEKEMPKIHLEYLPAYSPDYNLIELVWHSTKEYLAHRLFKSVEELEIVLHNLLNEGGLVIKWNRKLKNKGNSVSAV